MDRRLPPVSLSGRWAGMSRRSPRSSIVGIDRWLSGRRLRRLLLGPFSQFVEEKISRDVCRDARRAFDAKHADRRNRRGAAKRRYRWDWLVIVPARQLGSRKVMVPRLA